MFINFNHLYMQHWDVSACLILFLSPAFKSDFCCFEANDLSKYFKVNSLEYSILQSQISENSLIRGLSNFLAKLCASSYYIISGCCQPDKQLNYLDCKA